MEQSSILIPREDFENGIMTAHRIRDVQNHNGRKYYDVAGYDGWISEEQVLIFFLELIVVGRDDDTAH